jgi:protein-L-isoaspartate(D-aspartate) O-methyltransferase
VNSRDRSGSGMTSQRTRERMVERLRAQGISTEAVLDVMRTTPRHLFLDEALAHRAYEDSALPIGYQQTLSQPWIVARMTELLLRPGLQRVLEIGAGSGYQTAVLAQLVPQVFALERIRPLLSQARARLRALRLHNVLLRHGDGFEGWPESAPYDDILCAAAPESIPQALIDQLAIGGVLVMPVGSSLQQLVRVTRTATGSTQEVIEAVRFVPLLPGVVK